MKYLVISECRYDTFVEEFSTLEEAVKSANYHWSHMTKNDKNECRRFYVLESVNPGEEADDHYDGNYVKEYK